jgi:hypothetical protein
VSSTTFILSKSTFCSASSPLLQQITITEPKLPEEIRRYLKEKLHHEISWQSMQDRKGFREESFKRKMEKNRQRIKVDEESGRS